MIAKLSVIRLLLFVAALVFFYFAWVNFEDGQRAKMQLQDRKGGV